MEVTRQEEIERRPNLAETLNCELDEPRWSVVSFDRLEARGLTYSKAIKVMFDLEIEGVSGLCIVTDEAAKRKRS